MPFGLIAIIMALSFLCSLVIFFHMLIERNKLSVILFLTCLLVFVSTMLWFSHADFSIREHGTYALQHIEKDGKIEQVLLDKEGHPLAIDGKLVDLADHLRSDLVYPVGTKIKVWNQEVWSAGLYASQHADVKMRIIEFPQIPPDKK